MLIGMLLTVLITGILVAGPSIDNLWLAIAVYGGIVAAIIIAWLYAGNLSNGIAGFMLGGTGGKGDKALGLARRYEIDGDYQAAVAVYNRVIKRQKKNPLPRIKLAELHYKLGDYDRFVRYMDEALAVGSKLPQGERCELINRIADAHLHRRKDPASAIAILRRLVQQFPDSKYALYARERIMQIKESA